MNQFVDQSKKVRKMKLISLIFLSVILTTECSPSDRPAGVPAEATYREKEKDYYLFDKVGKEERYRSWDLDGKISFERIGKGENAINRNYINGKLVSEETDKERKEELNRKPEKASSIPKSAEYNKVMSGWELGKKVKGKKDGIWKVWYESGKPMGYVTYSNGKRQGKMRIYLEKIGELFKEYIFKDDKIVERRLFLSKFLYNKLPEKNRKRYTILPENEPKIHDIFDKL